MVGVVVSVTFISGVAMFIWLNDFEYLLTDGYFLLHPWPRWIHVDPCLLLLFLAMAIWVYMLIICKYVDLIDEKLTDT